MLAITLNSLMAKLGVNITKIQLNVPLVKEGESVPIIVRGEYGDPEGKTETLSITADRGDIDTTGFLQLGVTHHPSSLKGPQHGAASCRRFRMTKSLRPGHLRRHARRKGHRNQRSANQSE